MASSENRPVRFRAATYNIHKSKGVDRRIRPARIAEVLDEIAADIIALQEVLEPHVEEIRAESGYAHVFGAAEKYRGQEHGNVVLTRFPIVGQEHFDISVAPRSDRQCVRVDLDVSGRVLHLFAVHMGVSWFERRRQIDMLMTDHVLQNPHLKGPRILLGDFNEWTRGVTTRRLLAQFKGADIRQHLERPWTYPGVAPILHLDHIYYDPPLCARSARLHRTRKALVASDHLPLYADFEW
jgi:endonuclease/exonuclease/phosphatase family metal-dependent hydrolase